MKKLLIVLFLGLMLITIVSAETFKQNTEINFEKTCTNDSDAVCSVVAECNLTIRYPRNNTELVKNVVMTNNNNGIFNYSIKNDTINIPGSYPWDMFCCDGEGCGEAHGKFSVTATGVELSQDKALIYLGLLALLVFIFLIDLVGIFLLPSRNATDEEGFFIGINSLKYLRPVLFAIGWVLLMSIFFTSSNIAFLYLETAMMGSFLFAFYKMMGWLSTPMVLFWLLFIFVQVFRDKELKNLIERGVDVKDSP